LDVEVYVYGLQGRCLFRVGELDNWNVIYHLMGTSGTGKSEALKPLMSLMPREINISAREETFALEPLYRNRDADVLFDGDAKEGWLKAFGKDAFQKQVGGERFTCAVKAKSGIGDFSFRAPIVLASQYSFSGVEKSGEISRRIARFDFNNKVPKCVASKGAIGSEVIKFNGDRYLMKILLSYGELLRMHGGESHFSKFSDDISYFKNQREMSQDEQPLSVYLNSKESEYEKAEGYACIFSNFASSMKCILDKSISLQDTGFAMESLKIKKISVCSHCERNRDKSWKPNCDCEKKDDIKSRKIINCILGLKKRED